MRPQAAHNESDTQSLFYSLPDLHPCTRACHAPSACPETEPCESLVTLTCPCNRIRQSIPCGQTITYQHLTTGSSGHSHATVTPKCNNDCQVAKRNARLADALGISQEGRDSKSVVYNDELVGFARGNSKFLGLVEKTFAE